MRFSNVPAVVMVTALLLAGYAAHAQTPMQTSPATMQATPPSPAPRPGNYYAIDSAGGGAIPALPLDVLVSSGISYINGGIGDEELAELKAKEKDFNLHILLSSPKGDFISDVTLAILDHTGAQLLSIDDAGPYVYAELPPGSYTLEATDNGERKKIKISVKKNSNIKQHLVFREAGGITTPHQPTATVE